MDNILDVPPADNGSWLNLAIEAVWWQNKNWSIELLQGSKEIAVTDGYSVSYGHWDADNRIFKYDNPYWLPKYVKQKAIQLAIKYDMCSIYRD